MAEFITWLESQDFPAPLVEASVATYRAIFEGPAEDRHARYLYHRSNPAFRDKIKAEGLKPQVGESYELLWKDRFPGKRRKPLVFLFDSSQLYDSTYDDDLVRVDTSFLDLGHVRPDPAFDGEWCYTYDLPIPPEALEFVYEGTGDADGDGAGNAWELAVRH